MDIHGGLPPIPSLESIPQEYGVLSEPIHSIGEKVSVVADKILQKSIQTEEQNEEDDLFFEEIEEESTFYTAGKKIEIIEVAEAAKSAEEAAKSAEEAAKSAEEAAKSVIEEVRRIAEKTLDVKKTNEALTETDASLAEKLSADNLSVLASYNLSKVNNNHLQEDVSKLKQGFQQVRDDINENNSTSEAEVLSQSTTTSINDDKDARKMNQENAVPHKQVKQESVTPTNDPIAKAKIISENLADVRQKFINLNLPLSDNGNVDKVIDNAVINLNAKSKEKNAEVDEYQARQLVEIAVKQDVIDHGNAHFTEERILKIADKVLDTCIDNEVIFRRNPDGTFSPALFTPEELADLRNAFRQSFITSLNQLGLIQKTESGEPKTKQEGETSQTQAYSNLFSEQTKTSSLKDRKVTFIIAINNDATTSGIMTESQLIKILIKRWSEDKLQEDERVKIDLKHFNIKVKEIERQEFKGSVLKADRINRIILKSEVAKSQKSQ